MFGRITLSALALAGCSTVVPAGEPASKATAEILSDRAVWGQTCTEWDDWDKPALPYLIHGDSWYVGTCGISAILIASDEGHMLIDSGTEAGAAVVLDNIRKLGFDPADVEYLLHSHEHFDHVGGHALVKAATGARVVASEDAAVVIGTGRDHPDDPQFGMHPAMTPVNVDRVILDGETIELGGRTFTAIATPGHTPGALSWQWESCEDGECVTLVYADSLSPVSRDGYAFGDYPDYTGAYRQALGRLASLECDLLLTPHPSASDMVKRLKGEAPWIDSDGCRNYAAAIGKRLDERLAKEAE